jgi:hypothetical protein
MFSQRASNRIEFGEVVGLDDLQRISHLVPL